MSGQSAAELSLQLGRFRVHVLDVTPHVIANSSGRRSHVEYEMLLGMAPHSASARGGSPSILSADLSSESSENVKEIISWTVRRRYSEFYVLLKHLGRSYGKRIVAEYTKQTPFPPKRRKLRFKGDDRGRLLWQWAERILDGIRWSSDLFSGFVVPAARSVNDLINDSVDKFQLDAQLMQFFDVYACPLIRCLDPWIPSERRSMMAQLQLQLASSNWEMSETYKQRLIESRISCTLLAPIVEIIPHSTVAQARSTISSLWTASNTKGELPPTMTSQSSLESDLVDSDSEIEPDCDSPLEAIDGDDVSIGPAFSSASSSAVTSPSGVQTRRAISDSVFLATPAVSGAKAAGSQSILIMRLDGDDTLSLLRVSVPQMLALTHDFSDNDPYSWPIGPTGSDIADDTVVYPPYVTVLKQCYVTDVVEFHVHDRLQQVTMKFVDDQWTLQSLHWMEIASCLTEHMNRYRRHRTDILRHVQDLFMEKCTPFDKENPTHESKLALLWKYLVVPLALADDRPPPTTAKSGSTNTTPREHSVRAPDFERKSEWWTRIGFQGCDPATDFRGCGALGLEFLLDIAMRKPDMVLCILKSLMHAATTFDPSVDTGGGSQLYEYPFCVASFAVIQMIFDALPYTRKEKEWTPVEQNKDTRFLRSPLWDFLIRQYTYQCSTLRTWSSNVNGSGNEYWALPGNYQKSQHGPKNRAATGCSKIYGAEDVDEIAFHELHDIADEEGVGSPLCTLYAILIEILHGQWIRQSAHYMQFPSVLATVKGILETCLKENRPNSFTELRRCMKRLMHNASIDDAGSHFHTAS